MDQIWKKSEQKCQENLENMTCPHTGYVACLSAHISWGVRKAIFSGASHDFPET